MKIGWIILNSSEDFWVKVFKSKYGDMGNWRENEAIGAKNASNLWKNLIPNIKWTVEDGKRSKFWSNYWEHGISKLKDKVVHEVPPTWMNN